MAYFKEGEVVTIRSDLKKGKMYHMANEDGTVDESNGQECVPSIIKVAGKQFEIYGIHSFDGKYILKNKVDLPAVDEMFEEFTFNDESKFWKEVCLNVD